MTQLELNLVDYERELLGLITGITEAVGRKTVAYDLGISTQKLSHMLNAEPKQRHRHAFRVEYLVVFMRYPGGEAIVEYLAGLCGRQVIEATPPSAEEEVIAMRQAARELLGGELHKGFLRAAQKRLRQNRGAKVRGEG